MISCLASLVSVMVAGQGYQHLLPRDPAHRLPPTAVAARTASSRWARRARRSSTRPDAAASRLRPSRARRARIALPTAPEGGEAADRPDGEREEPGVGGGVEDEPPEHGPVRREQGDRRQELRRRVGHRRHRTAPDDEHRERGHRVRQEPDGGERGHGEGQEPSQPAPAGQRLSRSRRDDGIGDARGREAFAVVDRRRADGLLLGRRRLGQAVRQPLHLSHRRPPSRIPVLPAERDVSRRRRADPLLRAPEVERGIGQPVSGSCA